MTWKGELKVGYRVLFIFFVAVIFFFSDYFPCLKLEIPALPRTINTHRGIRDVIFLYSDEICDSCPVGRFLLSNNERKDTLIIVPGHFSEIDIENLRTVFKLEVPVIKGNDTIEQFIKKVAMCGKLEDWQTNLLVEIDANSRISSMMKL